MEHHCPEPFTEGRCAQLPHVGPLSEEGPTSARVHAFIARRGRFAAGITRST